MPEPYRDLGRADWGNGVNVSEEGRFSGSFKEHHGKNEEREESRNLWEDQK